MSILPVPHLIVINSTTKHHHIPEDDPTKLTPEAVLIFLEQIYNQSAPVSIIMKLIIKKSTSVDKWLYFQIYGGDSFAVRLYRTYFQARTSLEYMWTGNPVLTTLIFGLPLGFLSLIFYSVCCTDILDAEEEDSSEGIVCVLFNQICIKLHIIEYENVLLQNRVTKRKNNLRFGTWGIFREKFWTI